ncbi:alpha/beta fold hydrolase [Nocardioides jishulii]|uniref:Alpha/beta hydrolase n=1 Tax=Nocardioides jishulii TaxID=2575440 RepID=A0A4V5TKM8_9ACTN|nr:alpha/beta hydrolase [Nocardioides jishulii]QCX28800.1 alpha/beta hydrolase [Nocardioides jishulii]TKI64303.1 alpha/beta hydrolase [Nocardioides jishulii]
MSTTSESILFISGAGLRAWVWDDVRADLDVPSAVAPRPATGSASVRDHAEAAIAAVGPGSFTVVAHSIGGVVASEILGLVPERVRGVLGLSAVIPRPGGSFVSAMPRPNRWVLPLLLRLSGTRPPESVLRRGLGDGLDEEPLDRVVSEFTPESRQLYLDRVAGHRWTGRTGYVVTSQDRELPRALQQRFAQQLGGDWCEELATGHLPMLQQPHETAAAIRRFVAATAVERL